MKTRRLAAISAASLAAGVTGFVIAASPAFAAPPANGCPAGGVQLGNQLTPFGLPIYNFIDNQLPASS